MQFAEENCLPNLTLTLILTGGQFSSWGNCPHQVYETKITF